ncbi:MAG: hypothetical protein IPH03_02345 [Tetrasphaera sp.]|nr:hypothetical protein [Tetrasphaera sp.]
MAQIADAFHRTDLAAPTLHIQPEGNVTLVTLPTYVEVRWPTTGFQPGELDTLDPRHWFGMTVTIKPTLTSLTYDFGNGTGVGPTTSTGGPYPTGDITATYTDPGTFTVRADAVYTGYVSIDGSDWIEIPAPPRSRACPNPSWSRQPATTSTCPAGSRGARGIPADQTEVTLDGKTSVLTPESLTQWAALAGRVVTGQAADGPSITRSQGREVLIVADPRSRWRSTAMCSRWPAASAPR